jgi:hypothetical protein
MLISEAVSAQKSAVTIEVVDGKSGKPLAHAHILVFTSDEQPTIRTGKSLGTMTDERGLVVSETNSRFVQVLVDSHKLCQKEPNLQSFEVSKIVVAGLTTPNNCSSIVKEVTPGKFVVFARSPTFWEHMRW